MKIVINKCFGGFGLSPKAVKRFYELEGKTAYLFTEDYSSGDYGNRKYIPLGNEEATIGMFFTTFDVPNPNDIDKDELWENHYLSSYDIERTNKNLIRTVKELKKEANGSCAELAIVEIPDGVEYEIDEYDGIEHIA